MQMTTKLTPLSGRAAWKALEAHYEQIHDTQIKQLFSDDPARGERYTLEATGSF
jgi:glucose-6-phosphate isomerase